MDTLDNYVIKAYSKFIEEKEEAKKLRMPEVVEALGIEKIVDYLKRVGGVEIRHFYKIYWFEARKGRNCNFCVFNHKKDFGIDGAFRVTDDNSCFFPVEERKPYKKDLERIKHYTKKQKQKHFKYTKYYQCAVDLCIPLYERNESAIRLLIGEEGIYKTLKKDLINWYFGEILKYIREKR